MRINVLDNIINLSKQKFGRSREEVETEIFKKYEKREQPVVVAPAV